MAPALYVVSLAGSAGGFGPLAKVLASLPRHLGAAVVPMLHTGPGSMLAEALKSRSRLQVRCASSGDVLMRGHAYIAPAGSHLIVNPDARLTVYPGLHVGRYRPSADWLFESAAASFGRRHVAVVLSGMMSDGAAGLRRVRAAGGTVLVQAPEECAYPQMPFAAMATGCVDRVVPIEGMAAAICEMLSVRDRHVDRVSWETPFDDPAAA